MVNGTNEEILKEILFDRYLTDHEHSLLGDLIENRLHQLYKKNVKDQGDTREEEMLELLKFKISKWVRQ
tara:strand:- start:267 stop:473 length:207 start_codon:yes stop_codon:yes gene_type:complete